MAGGDAAAAGEGLLAGPPSRPPTASGDQGKVSGGDRGEVGGGDRGGGDRGVASGVTGPGTVNGINDSGCSVPCKK